jgi:hypothetical protein
VITAFRRTGADLPFADPAGHHDVPMEGYYWRLVDPVRGRAIVALCGVVSREGERRALVALGATGVPARFAWVNAGVRADARALRLEAGAQLRADPTRLMVDLGPGARLDVGLGARRPWPRRALGGLGAAHLVPGLQQYWHPHLLGGEARGVLELGGGTDSLEGLGVYAEKNWGRGFPGMWWWGQAQLWVAGDDASLAFAGGRLIPHPPHVAATAVVLRLGTSLVRLVPPVALVRTRIGAGHWHVRADGPRSRIEIEADAGPEAPLRLPVPPLDGHVPGEVAQYQAARMRVVLRRGRRTVWRGESALAGVEFGELRDSPRR